MNYTISQAARVTGVTPRAIRLYESKGLLPPADRSPSGYRLFDAGHVEILTFIRQARSLGLSLEGIAEIVALSERGTEPCPRTNALLAQRVDEIDQAIVDLQQLRDAITNAQDANPAPPGARCSVIENAGHQTSRSN